MGARGLPDNCVDHGVLLRLEIHQVVGASEKSHGDAALPAYRGLSRALPHPGRRRERPAVLLPSTLEVARRRKGTVEFCVLEERRKEK